MAGNHRMLQTGDPSFLQEPTGARIKTPRVSEGAGCFLLRKTQPGLTVNDNTG